MESNIFEPPLGDPFSKAFKIISIPIGSNYRTGCCNCGLPLTGQHHLELDRIGTTKMYAACSEGCAINIWTRGHCATDGKHPWNQSSTDVWLAEWPEVKEIRSRLLASENREQ